VTSVVIKRLILLMLAPLFAAGMTAQAQQLTPPYVQSPADPGLIEPPPSTPDAGPAIPGVADPNVTDPGVPDPTPNWQYERTTTNQAGTVQNTHRHTSIEDATQGSEYRREHLVTNPRGEMVQSWEQIQNEEGYQYRRAHTFTAPDGTLLRQQEWTRTGTDPYNFTREQQHQLRDGRTILHRQTRTWDGTSGTMERTFTGPNGQTRHSLRPWAPDEQVLPEPGPITPEAMAAATPAVSPPVVEPKKNRWGWMEKLNPFRKGGPLRSTESSPPRRAGFTVGSGRPQIAGRMQHGLNKTQPGNPSPNSRRPNWAGPHGGPPPGHANRSASRPSGRGRIR
jgi:hypothetical protein